VAGPDPSLHVFRVGRVRCSREPNQVAEQRGDDLAFLCDGTSRRSVERRGALPVEVKPFRVSLPQTGQVITSGAYTDDWDARSPGGSGSSRATPTTPNWGLRNSCSWVSVPTSQPVVIHRFIATSLQERPKGGGIQSFPGA
jgi:hypothetical protein